MTHVLPLPDKSRLRRMVFGVNLRCAQIFCHHGSFDAGNTSRWNRPYVVSSSRNLIAVVSTLSALIKNLPHSTSPAPHRAQRTRIILPATSLIRCNRHKALPAGAQIRRSPAQSLPPVLRCFPDRLLIPRNRQKQSAIHGHQLVHARSVHDAIESFSNCIH